MVHVKPDASLAGRDRYGDPLPRNVLARLGTMRLRHGGGPYAVAYSSDGKRLASVSATDGTIRIWNAIDGREQLHIEDDLKRDWVTPDGRARIEVFPKSRVDDNAGLARFTETVRSITPDITGFTVGIQESSRTIVQAFLQAGCWALLSITVLLIFTLRRVPDVLLTLAPLLLAGLVTLATCVVIDLPLNFENIIV